jgi:signal transduction histidine kinase/DNA-binding response OmpR family regulator
MQDDVVHENREKIFGYISNNPGSHLRKISRELNMRLSTLRYHLDHLEKTGLVVSQKQNNLKIYFVPGKLKPEEMALTQLLQQKRFRDIILVLIDSPGSTFSQIAEKLSMSHSTASKYINILENRKILSHKKVGRKKIYRINDEKSVIELLKTYKKFMADMSFEIRMPMNAIVGMTSLLLDENMTAEQRDFVETIRISADALMAVVKDILDFSKIELEKTELEIKTFDLRNCVEDSLQSVAEKATAKSLDLAYAIDKVSPDIIIGDPKKLRQILINLLNNAVKFTENGGVYVSVSSLFLDPLYEIHFEVRDTGVGIPEDKLDRLFNSCSKYEMPNMKRNKVANTSLFTSRELVELMSGRIWVESKLEEGSTFHFTIKTKHVPHISPLSGIQLPLNGKRILIAEKNKTIRNILEIQATEWGMIPITCTESEESLRLISVDPFDIALLDDNVPMNNGFSLGEEMRKINTTLPLISLTFAGKRIRPELYASTLVKPFRQSDLFNALKTAFTEQSISICNREPTAESSSNSTHSVLIAEDNLSNQKVILYMLKRLGYRAQAVYNGKEALQALECGSYDIILMDVRMPEMDGLEATRIIRERWHNKMKIIAITAYALKGDRERCLAAGMDDYINKPVRIGELKEMLRKHQTD